MTQKKPPRRWPNPFEREKALYLALLLLALGLALGLAWFEGLTLGRPLLILAIPFALAALVWLYRRDPG